MLVTGIVEEGRSSLEAYGQRPAIERGLLIFNGGVENPGLDVRALRKNPAVEAGICVTGTVRSPYVTAISDPPVRENKALAWLILGHGPAEASRGGLAGLPLAATSILGGNRSGRSLAIRLGVDAVRLNGNDAGSQMVTLWKRLSDRLYVAYEQGIVAAATILKLDFSLTRQLVLRVEAGETSALGIFFRSSFD